MFSSPNLWAELVALLQVLLIDLVLAGDNAIVVGLAVNGLPVEQRRRAILFGIAAATLLRIAFALVTLQLLAIVGLLLAGGILLLWVCWRMYRELRPTGSQHQHDQPAPKTMRAAMWQIVLADLSMSLDNVLAVAGAGARAPLGVGGRPGHLRRADGRGREPGGKPARPVPLARLGRPGDRALHLAQDDLGRQPRGRFGPRLDVVYDSSFCYTSMMRTNIIIENTLMSEAMRIAGVTTKKAAVDCGLRLLVDRGRQLEALDGLAGIGWDGDLDELRSGRDL